MNPASTASPPPSPPSWPGRRRRRDQGHRVERRAGAVPRAGAGVREGDRDKSRSTGRHRRHLKRVGAGRLPTSSSSRPPASAISSGRELADRLDVGALGHRRRGARRRAAADISSADALKKGVLSANRSCCRRGEQPLSPHLVEKNGLAGSSSEDHPDRPRPAGRRNRCRGEARSASPDERADSVAGRRPGAAAGGGAVSSRCFPAGIHTAATARMPRGVLQFSRRRRPQRCCPSTALSRVECPAHSVIAVPGLIRGLTRRSINLKNFCQEDGYAGQARV